MKIGVLGYNWRQGVRGGGTVAVMVAGLNVLGTVAHGFAGDSVSMWQWLGICASMYAASLLVRVASTCMHGRPLVVGMDWPRPSVGIVLLGELMLAFIGISFPWWYGMSKHLPLWHELLVSVIVALFFIGFTGLEFDEAQADPRTRWIIGGRKTKAGNRS